MKSKCYSTKCKPVETGFNMLKIYVCKECKIEITEELYHKEMIRIEQQKLQDKEQEKKKAEESAQSEMDYYGFI